MALATYSDLKTSIASWLHRTDLTAVIPDFIVIAESRFRKKVKMAGMETDASLVAIVGSRYVALPSDFNEPIALWNENWQPRTELRYLDYKQMQINTNLQSFPQFFTIDNSNIAFDIEADLAYPLTLRYFKKFTLSDSATTNALLTKYPEIYLYGSLVSAAEYIGDDEQLSKWQSLLNQAMQEANTNEARSKSLSTLSTDIVLSGARSNIFRGF